MILKSITTMAVHAACVHNFNTNSLLPCHHNVCCDQSALYIVNSISTVLHVQHQQHTLIKRRRCHQTKITEVHHTNTTDASQLPAQRQLLHADAGASGRSHLKRHHKRKANEEGVLKLPSWRIGREGKGSKGTSVNTSSHA